MLSKRKRREFENPSINHWTEINNKTTVILKLTKKIHGYKELLKQVNSITGHDNMCKPKEDEETWASESFNFIKYQNDIFLFLKTWSHELIEAFKSSKEEKDNSYKSVVDSVKTNKNQKDILKVSQQLSESNNIFNSLEIKIKKWNKIIRSNEDSSLDKFTSNTEDWVKRWIQTWSNDIERKKTCLQELKLNIRKE